MTIALQRSGHFSGKDVVRGDVHQREIVLFRHIRQIFHCRAVDAVGVLLIVLRLIYRCVSRRIDNNVNAVFSDKRLNRSCIGDV